MSSHLVESQDLKYILVIRVGALKWKGVCGVLVPILWKEKSSNSNHCLPKCAIFNIPKCAIFTDARFLTCVGRNTIALLAAQFFIRTAKLFSELHSLRRIAR